MEKIYRYLPLEIKLLVRKAVKKIGDGVIELRFRVMQSPEIITIDSHYFLSKKGDVKTTETKYKITPELINKIFIILTENSLYAVERELKEGFITIEGGHRVGFTGETILEDGQIKRIKNINSINFRINYQIVGIADKVIKYIYNFKTDHIYNTLLIAPPLCGKTTLLRDIVRIISEGKKEYNIRSQKTAVVDERSEIGGAYKGIPQNDLGSRTDLLDKCPKSEGILMLIRTMSPEIIAVDELGGKEDIEAIKRALNSGVRILATIHGDNYKSISNQNNFKEIINNKYFSRFIVLGKSKGVGTIEKILDKKGGCLFGRDC